MFNLLKKIEISRIIKILMIFSQDLIRNILEILQITIQNHTEMIITDHMKETKEHLQSEMITSLIVLDKINDMNLLMNHKDHLIIRLLEFTLRFLILLRKLL